MPAFRGGKNSSPWNFLRAGARAPHATMRLSLTPPSAGALPVPGRGTPRLRPPQTGAARCKVPCYRSSLTQNVLPFPRWMLKIHAKPKVKSKNQKQSGSEKPPALPYAWSYVRRWQFWCGEGIRLVSPFVLQLCSIKCDSLLLLRWSSMLLFINARILGFLWYAFSWYCMSGLVGMKCLDFQNMSTWMQQSVFSLFLVTTVSIGKHQQRAKTLVRITGTFKKG